MKPTMHDVLSTPVLDLLRGRVAPMQFSTSDAPSRSDANTLVERSGLPDPAKGLIKRVIRKTRLWRSEKLAVAEELIAHFIDGLESGRSADDLVTSFGDPAKAAKLIRRAKRRNRPLWWQIWYRSGQAIACFIAVYVGAALLLLTSRPTPTVDYVARLNATSAGAPTAERAWPIYRDVFTELNTLSESDVKLLDSPEETTRALDLCQPGDPGWPAAVALIHKHEAMLTKLRQAAGMRYFGLVIGTAAAFTEQDRAALGCTVPATAGTERTTADVLLENATISILLPHLAKMRTLTRLLCVDALDAAARGDGQRILDDYRTIIGMAHHVREHPILISQLVGVGMCSQANNTLQRINLHHPESLATCRVPLIHAAAAAEGLYTVDISFERAAIADMIQRMYSDSGNGDGHLTPAGLQILSYMSGNHRPYPLTVGSKQLNGWMVAPLAVTVVASRREATAMADHCFELMEQDLREPLWVRLKHEPRADQCVTPLRSSGATAIYYAPIAPLIPQLSRAGQAMDTGRAIYEATMTALALDVYRERSGNYPDDLMQLVPQYLPEVPLDLSTGQPLLYKLKDGKPLLYGRGLDGKDDGGVWVPEKDKPWPQVPTNGDWVLYPMPEPQKQ